MAIYEETDSRLIQLEKLRAHVLRTMRTWRPERFSSPQLFQERIAFGERCVTNLELAIEREIKGCQAGKDGDCYWKACPQLRDGEPGKTGRHCPLDVTDE